MTFSLNTKIIEPEKNSVINNAIILLHGYGGDGKDIGMLTVSWKRFLPNTIFLCPDGHEVCPINPSGFQWFDLTKDDPEYILEQSIKYDNVKVYDFQIAKDVTHNLDNYMDTNHYSGYINKWIIKQIKNDKYLVSNEDIRLNMNKLREQINKYIVKL